MGWRLPPALEILDSPLLVPESISRCSFTQVFSCDSESQTKTRYEAVDYYCNRHTKKNFGNMHQLCHPHNIIEPYDIVY